MCAISILKANDLKKINENTQQIKSPSQEKQICRYQKEPFIEKAQSHELKRLTRGNY